MKKYSDHGITQLGDKELDAFIEYDKECDQLMKWSKSFKTKFEKYFIKNIKLLSENDWISFKNKMKKSK